MKFVLAILFPVACFAGELKTYDARHHTIHTDLGAIEAREAQIRVNRMTEEYLRRTEGFAGKLSDRLPFYLYTDEADYLKAGGIKESAGLYTGKQLLALVERRDDGLISMQTWKVVQHEGFHQFADAVIGGDVPMWADEGLAEYFGEALFTGDGFVSGIIPRTRLARLKAALQMNKHKPLARFFAITRQQWNESVELANYDQAWSLVHFFAHANDGKHQEKFVRFMNEIGNKTSADKAFAKTLNTIPNLEITWRNWWLNQPENPSRDLYAKAVVSILTSYLARASSQGQTFASFDAFLVTPYEKLTYHKDDWLPPSLWKMGVYEAQKLIDDGARFALSSGVWLTLKDGTRLVGRFGISEGRGATVTVEWFNRAR